MRQALIVILSIALLTSAGAPAVQAQSSGATNDPREAEVNQIIQKLNPETQQRVQRLWNAAANDPRSRDDLYKALTDLRNKTAFRWNDPNLLGSVGSLAGVGGVGVLMGMAHLGMMGAVAGPVGFVVGAVAGGALGYMAYLRGKDLQRWRFGWSTLSRLEDEFLKRANPQARQNWWQIWRSRPTWPQAATGTGNGAPSAPANSSGAAGTPAAGPATHPAANTRPAGDEGGISIADIQYAGR